MSLEGQQIGRYRFLRQLGSGGMGEVYLAEDARIGQQVAIKVIRAELSSSPNSDAAREAARLFEREAKAIAKLDHPHILALFDYGEEHLQNMTLTYMVMPYRQEGSLTDWLRNHARLLSPQDIAHVVGQAAEALQHAHDHQIVHQDVKPSNFLIRHRKEAPNRPDLFLADFGVARLTSGTSSASQSVRGTPIYMAPEQWGGDAVPASDQYALAVMAYELLTGQLPFQGGLGQMMYQHLNVPPKPPSVLNPRLSQEIDMVLLHALAKRPQERFASVTAFATAFQQALQDIQTADAPTFLSPAPVTAPRFGRPVSTAIQNDDLKAMLAISATEARTGTSRTLTLPNGQRVEVQIPAGIHDGQTLRLGGQNTPYHASGAAEALILTIVVKGVEEAPFLSNTNMATVGPTALVPNAPTQPPIETRTSTINNTTPPGSSSPTHNLPNPSIHNLPGSAPSLYNPPPPRPMPTSYPPGYTYTPPPPRPMPTSYPPGYAYAPPPVVYPQQIPVYMPVPNYVRPPVAAWLTEGQRSGYIIASVGALLALIAFFAMPFFAAFGFLSSGTGFQAAQAVTQTYQLCQSYTSSHSPCSSSITLYLLLWLFPIFAGLSLLIAGIKALQKRPRRGGTGLLTTFGIVTMVALVISFFVRLSSGSSAIAFTSLFRTGIWVFVGGIFVVLVGSIIAGRKPT